MHRLRNMTRKRAISGKSCPAQKAEDGHKKHDFPDPASPDIGPERESRAAERSQQLAAACWEVHGNMCCSPKKERAPGAMQAFRPPQAIDDGCSHQQHHTGMGQTPMAKGFCQKTGKDFQPTAKHGALGIKVWQEATQQARAEGKRFGRQHMPAHGAQHGKAANQQMGTSGHAPL